MNFLNLPSPLEEIKYHPGNGNDIRLFIKRDDLIHPDISGNKWRKLKYNIEKAKTLGCTTIITAGGPWSNHLAATAAAAKIFGLEVMGIVRGEEPPVWSDTLKFCKSQDMKLMFVSRKEFDKLPGSITSRMLEKMNAFFIPVGGENKEGLQGCEEIINEVDIDFDTFCIPVGTGTTLTGVGRSIIDKRLIGFSALRDISQHSPEFLDWLKENTQVELTFEYSEGGFAKSSLQLEDFIVNFYMQNKIMLEPVYTGKMMFGVFDKIEKGLIEAGSSVVCLHTGGLQGLNGFADLHKRLFTS